MQPTYVAPPSKTITWVWYTSNVWTLQKQVDCCQMVFFSCKAATFKLFLTLYISQVSHSGCWFWPAFTLQCFPPHWWSLIPVPVFISTFLAFIYTQQCYDKNNMIFNFYLPRYLFNGQCVQCSNMSRVRGVLIVQYVCIHCMLWQCSVAT